MPDPIEPAQPRRGRCLMVEGRRVHVHLAGRGTPALLLHGNGGLGEEPLRALPRLRGLRLIAPDRPGYGRTEPLPRHGADPRRQADWAAGLLDALADGPAVILAHSLAAGPALWLARRHPERVRALVLVAPFCRPTPQRWMLHLRLLTRPTLGAPFRRALPGLAPVLRHRLLSRLAAPNRVPPSLRDFPLAEALRPRAVMTVAAELRAFNEGMEPFGLVPQVPHPVLALAGTRDGTADPDWHLPWLAERCARLQVERVEGAGHMLHHIAPGRVAAAVRRTAAGRLSGRAAVAADRPSPDGAAASR